jgi:TRAP-type C4-dicarboxylate transport system substrate-binding protein
MHAGLRWLVGLMALWLWAVGWGAGAGAAAAENTLRLASATVDEVQHEWQKRFAVELEARIGDAVTVEIHPAGVLGPIPLMIEWVLDGTIEAFTTPTSFLSTVDRRFQAFDAPGLFDGPAEVRRVMAEAAYRDHLETLFLDRGIRVIGAFYNSPTVVLTRRPARRLADLEGLRIRTFDSPLQTEPMAALGAVPVPLPLSEVAALLRAGELDGMLAGLPVLTAFRYWEVARHVTSLDFAEIVSVTILNEAWFQAQPVAVQDAIRDAGRAAEAAVVHWGMENVVRSAEVWRENGGAILLLDEADRASMTERFAAVTEAVLAAAPAARAEHRRLLELVEKGR